MIRDVEEFRNLDLELETPRSGLAWTVVKKDLKYAEKFIEAGAPINAVNHEVI